jgi:hypothetical protein
VPGVLYHPHFEPSVTWLRSSLLVYDTVWSIVPSDADYVPSDDIKRHLEKLPDTFAPLSPQPLDIVHEYSVLKVLARAFKRIAEQSNLSDQEGTRIRYKDRPWGSGEDELEISGVTKLHDSKVAYTVFQMLNDCNLIYGQAGDGFSYVNEQAAFLIVSFIAERMATRLPMRTITDIDTSFYLSAACNVIEAGGNPVDSHGVLASSVLKFHIPDDIGNLPFPDFVEIRKRYEDLRQAFPLYLRDLGELIQVDDVRHLPELIARIKSLVDTIDRDMVRIKRSQIGESIKRWLPIGVGCAVTVGSAFLPDNPSLKYVTGVATVAVQILTEAFHKSPIPGRLKGTQSLLLSAKEDILDAKEMARSLDMRTLI